MSGKTRKNRPDAKRHAASGGLGLPRQDSATQGKWLNDVFRVVESGTVEEIRVQLAEALLRYPASLLTQSMRNEHGLRTPLMAAAASGDYSLFTTVMHAVDRAIDLTAGRKFSAAELATEQLRIKDNWGMTLTMVAAETGNVPLIKTVLRRITAAEDHDRLLDSDYRGNTVLMHAASAGKSATFDGFLTALQEAFPEREVDEQLQAISGNGLNILMHAARCGDQLGVLSVINACKTNLNPSKVRHLVEHTDGDGMTFLMHAASCKQTGATAAARRAAAMAQRGEITVDPQQTSTQATADPSAPGYSSRAGGAPPPGRFPGIAEGEEDEEEEKEDVESGAHGYPRGRSHANIGGGNPEGADDALRGLAGRYGLTLPKNNPFAALMGQQGGGDEEGSERHTVVQGESRRRGKGGPEDPGLVVFKTVWAMVEEMLWKEQVRRQLKMTDTWDRNILIHAVQSGRVQVFEAAFNAMREHILDPETDELMNVDEDDNLVSAMEAALEEAPREMVLHVKRRNKELKKQIALDERASTIEAKMQSFIPGKLIVIFQLLLPEIGSEGGSGTGPLLLLLLLTLGAPFLTWGTTLISRDKPLQAKDARRSKMTNLLSAPAIFFWGLGTSDIGADSLGWSKTSSAAALAVATIVIPGLDAFFANRRVEQWFDKWSGQSLRYSTKANMVWQKEKKNLKKQEKSRERSRRDPGDDPDSGKKWNVRGLCQSLGSAGVADVLANPPSSEALLGHLEDGKDQLAGEMKDKGRALAADTNKQLQDATAGVASTLSHLPSQSSLVADGKGFVAGAMVGLEDGGGSLAGAMKERGNAFAAGNKQLQDARGVASTLAHAPSVALRGYVDDGKGQLTRAVKGGERAFAADSKQLQEDAAAVADTLAHPPSETLLGYLADGKDRLAGAMEESGRTFAADRKQLQEDATGVAETLAHLPTDALLGYLGDGKDRPTGAIKEGERAFAAGNKQLQDATAGIAASLAHAPSQETLLADGKGFLTGAMEEMGEAGGSLTGAMKERGKAFAADNKHLQEGAAAVADTLSHLPSQSSLLADGKGFLTGVAKEGGRTFDADSEQLQEDATGVVDTLSHPPSQETLLGYLGDGKNQLAEAVKERGRAFAADNTQLQQDATAVEDTLSHLASQATLVADGKGLLTGAVEGAMEGLERKFVPDKKKPRDTAAVVAPTSVPTPS